MAWVTYLTGVYLGLVSAFQFCKYAKTITSCLLLKDLKPS